MNNVNHIRFLLACFAMVFSLGALAEDGPKQVDRLELDSSSITGNQELPKVMYIVPWKEAGIGDLQGKPVNSLLDEVLAPLDREVFVRQVRYFDQLHASEPPADDAAD
jgi:hypothetical protein